MESIISLRAFAVDAPGETATWGLIGETDDGDWQFNHDPVPDRFGSAFEQFVDDELGDVDADRPAAQRVFGDVVVVLDELVFRVVDDGIECEYRLSTGSRLVDGRTICSDRNDADRGGTAERYHGDERIADAVQRTADALAHRIAWLDVTSPRSFAGVVEAAEDVVEDDR